MTRDDPSPEAKANELVARLARATWSRADELELGRITREANGLMAVDASGAHMVLGSVAAVRGDLAATRDHYRVALRLDGSYTTGLNYSIALALLEEHAEALEVAEGLLEAYADDVELLEHAIGEAVDAARFETAARLCEKHDRLVPNRAPGIAAPSVLSALQAGTFTEAGVRAAIAGVAEVQRDKGVRTANVRLSSHDGGESFLYLRGVYASSADVAELNENLAVLVAGRADLMEDPGLAFMLAFRPVEPDASNS